MEGKERRGKVRRKGFKKWLITKVSNQAMDHSSKWMNNNFLFPFNHLRRRNREREKKTEIERKSGYERKRKWKRREGKKVEGRVNHVFLFKCINLLHQGSSSSSFLSHFLSLSYFLSFSFSLWESLTLSNFFQSLFSTQFFHSLFRNQMILISTKKKIWLILINKSRTIHDCQNFLLPSLTLSSKNSWRAKSGKERGRRVKRKK